MYYKTILVQLNDERRAKALLSHVWPVAEAFGARVIGLAIVPPIVPMPMPYAGTPGLIACRTQRIPGNRALMMAVTG